MARKSAKHGRLKRKPVTIWPIDEAISLGTSADNVILTSALQTLTQDIEVYGVDLEVHVQGMADDDGPVDCGWAREELTGAEIVENRDAQPTSEHDIPATEHVKRKVRSLGMLTAEEPRLKKKRSRMFLRIPAGKAIADVWVINRSGSNFTAGATVHFQGHAYGRWK